MKGFSCTTIKGKLRIKCQVVENKYPRAEGKIIHLTRQIYFIIEDEIDFNMLNNKIVAKTSRDSHMLGCFID